MTTLEGPVGVQQLDRRPLIGYAFYLTAATLWSLNGVVAKIILEHGIPWYRLSEIRVTLAALVLLVWVGIRNRSALRLRREEIVPLLAYGILGIAATQTLYLVALQRMPISIALLIEFTAPIMVALYVKFVRRQPVSNRVFAALALAMIGLAMVAQVWAGLTLDALGLLAGIVAAVALAFYFLSGEKLVAHRDPVSLVMFGFIAASLFWVVVAPWWSYPWEYLSFTAQFAGVGPELPSWIYVAYLVVLGTVVPFALAMASMRHISASQASVVGMSEPVIAGVIAWVVLGEVLLPVQIVGGVVVLVGIVLAERSR
ncbi:MAG TPA: EamA family transporter [Candidatus Nanopelagicales bacterium]|nr:EamA family transporter [Candidatus Nanopelagicales bacterium]